MIADEYGPDEVSSRLQALADAVSMDAALARDERWEWCSALLRATGDLLPRGLGLLQAYHVGACLADADGIRPEGAPGLGDELEGRSLLSAAVIPWVYLSGTRVASRHQASVARYLSVSARSAPLPVHDGTWEAWRAFFEVVERAQYSSGHSFAECALSAFSDEQRGPFMEAGRAYALDCLREALAVAGGIYLRPAAPVPPTPEEAQTAPRE